MIEILTAAAIAAGVVILSGPFLIPLLHKLKFGQSIREEGPASHKIKSGTPTMGGIFLIAAIVIATLIRAEFTAEIFIALFIVVGHFILGFLDDYIKVVKKRNLGLKARQKLLGQIIIAAVTIYIATTELGIETTIWLPILNETADLGIFYYVLVLLVIVGASNAVHLTDGLDGLASGCMAIAASCYGVICLLTLHYNLAIFCAATVGACIGFLRFNFHPAKIFMGDTGSLFLGGAVAALAFAYDMPLTLIVLGIVYIVETLSVIIQVGYFKLSGGKRIFKMAPFHHHLELGGWLGHKWTEKQLFVLVVVVSALAGLISFIGISSRFVA